ncbi:MAG: hypothetical protein QOI21_2496 [Actinomycetota bacterium]|nr:hypothetical protein [Actinomycetota bacterium]
MTLSCSDEVVLLADDDDGFRPGDRGDGTGRLGGNAPARPASGAKLSIESTPGGGTAVSVQVPAIPAS